MANWATAFVVAGAVAAASLAGCKSRQASEPGVSSGGSPAAADAMATAAEPVEIVQQVKGSDEALSTPGVYLVKTAEELEARGMQEVPGAAVDWATQDVVILALGRVPTGGYSAEITAIQLEGDVLYVQGAVKVPAEGDAVSQAEEHPYVAAVVAETPATRALSDIEDAPAE